ncbi:uncharacterized protein SPSK_02748 [Sporothrix schenckii 1099-18]|uniref:WSC domain-containing protein n=1 Tax=Sporothrix schenckii 1099-18 TaxID=1397361 RepID=A0A0F2MEJ4_SPOSC|nr:uncharacterized protein SPSK_02748 [Sporothrix schenckii 1099-18]KJR86576.1 hypothetical protein SPSK_02748 [Sporothrix schenckii 1099-18]
MRQARLTMLAGAALLLQWAGAVAGAALATASSLSTTSTSSKTATTPTTTPSRTVYVASKAPTTGAAAATGLVRNYAYQGCYLEIAGTNGTAPGARSLQGDTTDEVLPGDMTVAKCLEYCGGGGSGTAYAYAGLEFSRECWCGQALSSLATKEAEAQCNLPCDGDDSTLCGGDLRLTVGHDTLRLVFVSVFVSARADQPQLYMLTSPATRPQIALAAMAAVAGLAAAVQLL